MRILFVTATRIGDAVLSTGVLAALIDRHPEARITVACGPLAAPLFAETPNLERVLVVRKRRGGFHWPALWLSVVGRRWDVIVDLRASAMSYLVPARRRLVHRRDDGPIHRVASLGALLGADDPPAPRVWTAPAHDARAAELLGGRAPLLAIGPGAGWRAKQWRPERFAELARRITGPSGILPGATVVMLGGASERAKLRPIAETLPECIDLVGAADLLTSHAVLARCRFFVGNDSGLMHMAAAAGIPTLGLFGPSREVHYAPWGADTAVVRTTQSYDALIGAPGYDHRTSDTLMDGLSVEMAERAAQDLWSRARGEAA